MTEKDKYCMSVGQTHPTFCIEPDGHEGAHTYGPVKEMKFISSGEAEAKQDGLRRRIDVAYAERNQLVAHLASLFPSSIERHDTDDIAWDDEWRWVVYIDHPEGQLSWHLHESHLPFFDHVVRGNGQRSWDGHTTEEKYERLNRACGGEGSEQA
jgi:hypothetical protein